MCGCCGLLLLLAIAGTTAAEDGLTHEWQFTAQRVQGGTVKAREGKLDATIVGPVQFSAETPRALMLKGDSSARHGLEVSSDLAAAGLPSRALTVEAWVQIEKSQPWGGIAGAFQDNGSYEKGWLLGYSGSQFFFAVATARQNRLTYLKARTTFQTGYWYHVVGTYDGAEQRLYVDGTLQAVAREQAGDVDYPPRGVLELGAYRDDNEHYSLAGQLESVSVFASSLSAESVAARFGERMSLFPEMEVVRPTVVDWPTYLRDNLRSGKTAENLRFPLLLQWAYRAPRPPEPAWPEEAKNDYWHQKYDIQDIVTFDRAFQLVSVGDRVYFGSSADDKVYCLDADTGRQRWSFTTEGPVRLAPTIVEDRVLCGSDDGHVYCLNARDGGLHWKQRLGPSGQRVPGNGRMISAWPIRTDVLVEESRAYVCAGVFPSQGVYQAVLDLQDGHVVERQQLGVTAQGYLERRGGQLMVVTGRNPAGAFVSKLKRFGKEAGKEVSTLPTDYPYAFISAGDVRFGGGDGRIAAFRAEDGAQVWSASVEGKVHSLAVARGRLLASTDQGMVYCFATDSREPRMVAPPAPVKLAESDEQLQQRYAAAAQWILEQAGTSRGYALVLGSVEGRLAYELAQRSGLQIIGVEPDEAHVASSRRMLDAAGLAGRVSIHHGPLDSLPFGDCVFNLVVSDSAALGSELAGDSQEAQRVLRPHGGVLVLGLSDSKLVRRGPLAGEGQWTHMYADSGHTSCSGDERLKGELKIQWFGRPGPRGMIDRHHRTVAPLYTQGRLFVPGEDRVTAVDAYNGTILWDREFPQSRRVVAFRDCSYLVASPTHVYVAAAAQCLAIDPQTGHTDHVYDLPTGARARVQEWGFVDTAGDLVLGSAVKSGSSRRTQSHTVDRTETYYDRVPLVGSDELFALDRDRGSARWQHRARSGLIVNPSIAVADGRMVFIESRNPQTLELTVGRATLAELLGKGADLVALDVQTGREVWRQPGDFAALEHNVYLMCSRGKIVVVGSRNSGPDKKVDTVFYDLHAFDAATGRRAWFKTHTNNTEVGGDHGEQDQHPVIVGDKLYCEPQAYDLHTGEPLTWNWPWVHKKRNGCGSLSASASQFFFRNGTVSGFDLTTSQAKTLTTETRPGCWINLLPAGGLLLAPEASSGCTCGFSVQTSLALIPVGP